MKTILVEASENTVISVTESAQYVLSFPEKSGTYSVDLHFDKQGVEAEILGLYVCGENENLSITTIATHKVPNTKCVTSVRGVLLDKGKSSYVGKILINKPAQQTSSYLDDAVLVVGNNTVNNSQPILEIEADDVKASHGATTGRIDEDQIYYLLSRGLNRQEAEDLIIAGFFERILNTIIDTDIREKVRSTLNVKFN